MKSSRSLDKRGTGTDDTQEVRVDSSLSKMDTGEIQRLPSGELYPRVDAALEPSKYFLSKTQKAVNIMIGVLRALDKEAPELESSNKVYRKEFNKLLGIANSGVFTRLFKEKLAVCINVVDNLDRFKLPGKCNERLGNVKRILVEEIKPKI